MTKTSPGQQPLRQRSSGNFNVYEPSGSPTGGELEAAARECERFRRIATELRVENAALREQARAVEEHDELVEALRVDNMRLRAEATRLRQENSLLRKTATETALAGLAPPPPPSELNTCEHRAAAASAPCDAPDGTEDEENVSPLDGQRTGKPVSSPSTERLFKVLSEMPIEDADDADGDAEGDESDADEADSDEEDAGNAVGWSAEAIAALAAEAEEMVIYADPPGASRGSQSAPEPPPPLGTYSPLPYTSAADGLDGSQLADAGAAGEHGGGSPSSSSQSPRPAASPQPLRTSQLPRSSRKRVVVYDDEDDEAEMEVASEVVPRARATPVRATRGETRAPSEAARHTPSSRRVVVLSDDEDEEGAAPSSLAGAAPATSPSASAIKAPPPRSLAEPRQRWASDEESDEADDRSSACGSDMGSFIVSDEEDPDYEGSTEDEAEDEDEDEEEEEEEEEEDDGGDDDDEKSVTSRTDAIGRAAIGLERELPPSMGKRSTGFSGSVPRQPTVDLDEEDSDEAACASPEARATPAQTSTAGGSAHTMGGRTAGTARPASGLAAAATPDANVAAPKTPLSAKTPLAAKTPSQAALQRSLQELAPRLYREFNESVFGGKLPADVPVVWNARLLTTAGQCVFRTSADRRTATIQLAAKVVDSEERLRKTLAHEMCHAAQWLLDGAKTPPHGPAFKRWARAFEQHVAGMRVTTCHSYDVFGGRFRYGCSTCGHEFARHTKSVQLERQRCGVCRGSLRFLGAFEKDGTPAKATRAPSAFAQYVQKHYAATKQAMPHASHQEVMAALGQHWRDEKRTDAIGTAAGDEKRLGAELSSALDLCADADEEQDELDDALAALQL